MKKTDRELLADALRSLEVWAPIDLADLTIAKEIRARLAEPEDEPVAWIRQNGFRFCGDIEPQDDSELPLYRHPPRPAENDAVNLYDYTGPILKQLTEKNQAESRQPARLSDEELQTLCLSHGIGASPLLFAVAKDIEDALLEKRQ